jgi:hypothetical protein
MLAGCRRAAEAAGDAGERPRGSASASAVLPSAGGLGCEIAEPLDDPFGSFAGARFRRRRPRIIMWCPQRSRTTYSPPGQGWSSLFLQVSRGTWKVPFWLSRPHPAAAAGSTGTTCLLPRAPVRHRAAFETTNHARSMLSPKPRIWGVSRGTSLPPRRSQSGRFTWNIGAAGVDLGRFGYPRPVPRRSIWAPSRGS